MVSRANSGVHIPNGISIDSAVLAQLVFTTNRGHTDTRRQTELRFSSVRVMRTRLYARQRKIRSISSNRPAGSVFCCCFLFSAIYFRPIISTSTGPIFAKFAVLVKLWLWAVNLKCCFSIPQGTLPWQQGFVGFIHPQNRVPVTFGRWR